MKKIREHFISKLVSDGMKEQDAVLFVNAVIDLTQAELRKGKDVSWLNLGTFIQVDRKPKKVRTSFKAGDTSMKCVAIRRPVFLANNSLHQFVKSLQVEHKVDVIYTKDTDLIDGAVFKTLNDYCNHQEIRKRAGMTKPNGEPCEYALIKKIKKLTGLNESDCVAAFSLFADYFADFLGHGHSISFKNLGRFQIKYRKLRHLNEFGEKEKSILINFAPSKKLTDVSEA